MLFNAKSTWFQLYHGENKLIFNEKMMMRSALYYTNTQNWIFIVLAHWNDSLRVDMSLHSDTLSCFRANQSLLLLLSAGCLAEMYQFYSLWFEPTGSKTTINHTRGQHANHYITDVVPTNNTCTTILPALFQYCYKYCYSDSRNLWAIMKAGGLAL